MNETTNIGKKTYREITSPPHLSWVVHAANIEFIEWKYKQNLLTKQIPRKTSVIIGRRKGIK